MGPRSQLLLGHFPFAPQETLLDVQNKYQMIRGPRPWEEDTIKKNAEIRAKGIEEIRRKKREGLVE